MTVHPRAGGERIVTPGDIPAITGSSPRGRGTRGCGGRDGGRSRFIPARAGNACSSVFSIANLPVHPRAGGERRGMAIPPTTAAGSSPRGRGTPRRASGEHSCDRFIPARAGNARLTGSSFSAVSVHPRAGGERYSNHELLHFITGSSPRGRGTLSTSSMVNSVLRFIPARAGNAEARCWVGDRRSVHPRAGGERCPNRPNSGPTCGSSPRGRGTPDPWLQDPRRVTVHPRAGGERKSAGTQLGAALGSSPRGRGTLLACHQLQRASRFIPARAGNASSEMPKDTGLSVHPRAGGERRRDLVLDAVIDGSSPRGRGTLALVPGSPGAARFIPARAGNAAAPAVGSVRSTVHPRAGGERHRQTAWMGTPCGSSPRGRGTRARFSPGGAGGRFIPARAGNASCPRSAPTPMPVHPRAGGERVNSWPARSTTAGSSPRGRGTRRKSQIATAPYRFIPARAGNANGSRPPRPARSVHPRAGGERIAGAFLSALEVGSSPRGRGTHRRRLPVGARGRFIPARAGNALRAAQVNLFAPVHPRAGGERLATEWRDAYHHGSSPRGRGTPGTLRFLTETRQVHPRAGGERDGPPPTSRRTAGSSPRGRGTPPGGDSPRAQPRFIPARAGNA